MVYRLYVEKKEEYANEAKGLAGDIRGFLGIKGLQKLRVLNRYDVENISEKLFNYAAGHLFSEPQVDIASDCLTADGGKVFAVEYLPGQFDQRADSAAQCLRIIAPEENPVVRTARIYILNGSLSETELEAIKKYVINPVEGREASLEMPETLITEYNIPDSVETLNGFTKLDSEGVSDFIKKYSLAMDEADLEFCRDYFASEKRDPSLTEIRMIDTYWSDHCRHTTFLTTIDSVRFEDEILEKAYNDYLSARKTLNRTKPQNLMDIATIAAKVLKKEGRLDKLDESEEINACTVKIKVDVDGKDEDWLLLFKNETHNHPTEIEPFGGAATCIGGAIRDPLSGRGYVYAAMRVTGGADPTRPASETIKGKLPQKKLVKTAAAGYSSYGNQIGLATGEVFEWYHDGYAAKRMEIGAVIAAAPEKNVRREVPKPGDIVILLGGRTGRDGCGGATGSSKSHNLQSLESCGAEVQKGNAPEERKLQRLFRNPEATGLIKRCNDFGAGGVSVAVGELADGLNINLDAVPKKYEGLDGTELAISESQERMAVVVAKEDAEHFMALADSENLEATKVAIVTDTNRLVMSWNGRNIVDISREFLNSNGAEKHIEIAPAKPEKCTQSIPESFTEGYKSLAGDLNVCSRRGLSERFDSTIGAGSVLMPFGGRNQLTPVQAMVNRISLEKGKTETVSAMAWGFNPNISEKSPYHGAYLAVVESISKLIATGISFEDVYLTFQEYFEKPQSDPKRWGKPLSALLGAFEAQKDYGCAAIGGKDSMSGSFENLNVPPTLVSFAVSSDKINNVTSPEFKEAGHTVIWLRPEYDEFGVPTPESEKKLYTKVTALMREGKVLAAYTPGYGGAAEAVMKMCFGNGIGFDFNPSFTLDEIFAYSYGSFILELSDNTEGKVLGKTSAGFNLTLGGQSVSLSELLEIYESKLEKVFPCNIKQPCSDIRAFKYKTASWPAPAVKAAQPNVLIPVFPGTNCEYDTARAFSRAGAKPEIFVINNLTPQGIQESVRQFAKLLSKSEIMFVPGGFSGGDEPDGSGKFICSFLRNAEISDALIELLDVRRGLVAGVCNGFQALIKLGLVPYGRIIDADSNSPTLTYNIIGRHQSRLVRTRLCSNKSPWLCEAQVDEIYTVPISHGEGRFIASDALIGELEKNGQIATQYVDLDGKPTCDIHFNPNGSDCAIEGITSPDGRVLGKMGHSERWDSGLYRNVPGDFDIGMFRSAVKYFK